MGIGVVKGVDLWGLAWWRVWVYGDRHRGRYGAIEAVGGGHSGCWVCGWSVSLMGGRG